jgi:hypothetical protein
MRVSSVTGGAESTVGGGAESTVCSEFNVVPGRGGETRQGVGAAGAGPLGFLPKRCLLHSPLL